MRKISKFLWHNKAKFHFKSQHYFEPAHLPCNRNLTNYVQEGVVAQLVERSLPIPEVRGSNPVICKNLY